MTNTLLNKVVEAVRKMNDDELLELVHQATGGKSYALPSTASKALAAVPAKEKEKGSSKQRGPRMTAEEKATFTVEVEKVVKRAQKGMSRSEIQKETGIPDNRIALILRAAKEEKKIYQGGDRRFARYAKNERAAVQAANEARTAASAFH